MMQLHQNTATNLRKFLGVMKMKYGNISGLNTQMFMAFGKDQQQQQCLELQHLLQ